MRAPSLTAVLMTIVMEAGLIHPPVGMNVFVIKSVIKDVKLSTVFYGVMPFVVTDILRLAILIALIGLANTLSLSIHERARELGLLRAVGLTRGRLRAMVRWESVITAVVGTVVGLGVGTFLGWGVIRVLSAQEGFVSFQLPAPTLAVVLVLSIAAGVLAAVRPAHRAAKLDVLDAIAEH